MLFIWEGLGDTEDIIKIDNIMANRKRTYYFISIQLKNNYVIDMGRAWRYRRYNQDRQYNGKRKKKTNAMNDNESHVGPG
jgi:hypothetical protein